MERLRAEFLDTVSFPLDPTVEDRIEELSFLAGGGQEEFRHHWNTGAYCCTRCLRLLYVSRDKWNGPCIWPSFRRGEVELAAAAAVPQPTEANVSAPAVNKVATAPASLLERQIFNYNNYKCAVFEVYCGGCQLFVGHKFEDGPEKGDKHPDARWRH